MSAVHCELIAMDGVLSGLAGGGDGYGEADVFGSVFERGGDRFHAVEAAPEGEPLIGVGVTQGGARTDLGEPVAFRGSDRKAGWQVADIGGVVVDADALVAGEDLDIGVEPSDLIDAGFERRGEMAVVEQG